MAQILSAIVSGLFGLMFCFAIWGLYQFIALVKKISSNIDVILDGARIVRHQDILAGAPTAEQALASVPRVPRHGTTGAGDVGIRRT